MQETKVHSLGWEDPLESKWQPTPVFLPGKSHGQRSLASTFHEVAKVGHDLATKPPQIPCVFEYMYVTQNSKLLVTKKTIFYIF